MEKSGRVLTTRALAATSESFGAAGAMSLLKRTWMSVRGGARARAREVEGSARDSSEGAMVGVQLERG